MFILLLLSLSPKIYCQTIDNPTVIKIGSCQTLTIALGPDAYGYTVQTLRGYDYFMNYHVKNQGPFLINGNYYTFELDVREYIDVFNPQSMFEDYADMYSNGVHAFMAPLLMLLYGDSVQEFFASLPIPPPLMVTAAKLDELSPYSNIFSATGTRDKSFESALKAVITYGAKNMTCLWAETDPANYDSCAGAAIIGRSFGLESGPIYKTMYDSVTPFVTREAIRANVSATIRKVRIDNPDILLISGYHETVSAVMLALRELNWTPKMIVTVPFIQPQYNDLVIDAEYVVGSSYWSSKLGSQGDPFFGTPEEFAYNYTKYTGFVPEDFDVLAVNSLLIIEFAIREAIVRFDITDGTIPTSDQIIFSMARLSTTSFAGDIFFNKYGGLESPWVATQLQGSGPPQVENQNNTWVPINDGFEHGSYNDSKVISPLELRTGSLIYPMPTFNERNENLSYYKNSAEIVFTVFTSVMIVILLAMCIIVIIWRDRGPIRSAQPEFVVLAMFGFAMICSSIYTWQLYVTNVSCNFTVWLLAIGMYMVLGSQILRTVRIYYLIRETNKMRYISITFGKMAIPLVIGGCLILIPLIAVTARSAIDAVVVVNEYRPVYNYTECVASKPAVELTIIIAYLGILVLTWGCIAGFSYKTLHAQYDFHETVISILCCILITVCGIILIVIQLIDVDNETQYYMRSAIILGCSVVYAIAIIYKLYETVIGVNGISSVGSAVNSRSTNIKTGSLNRTNSPREVSSHIEMSNA